MKQKTRRCAQAAVAGIIAAAPQAAIADPSPGPGSTTVPLPASVVQCLVQAGYQISGPTTVSVPPAGTSTPTTPSSPTDPGTTVTPPPTTGTGTPTPPPPTTPPLTTGTGTAPPPPPATGNATPSSGASSTAGVQCGQIIVNNTVYIIVLTVTTTTTVANGPQTAANGPVTINSGSSTETVSRTGGKTGRRRTSSKSPRSRKKSIHRKPAAVRKHRLRHRARKPIAHVALVAEGERA